MKQEMKLAARILENLPTMSADTMQGWIDNPSALRDFLAPLAPSETILNPIPKAKRVREQKQSAPIVINLDPFVPEGWKVEKHTLGGQFTFDPSQVKLHLDAGQQDGKSIKGTELRMRLANVPLMNAVLLDWYLANPQYIPDEWKGKYVFFWGTVYRSRRGSLFVRCLYWSGDRWSWRCHWLGLDFNDRSPAAVHASTQP